MMPPGLGLEVACGHPETDLQVTSVKDTAFQAALARLRYEVVIIPSHGLREHALKTIFIIDDNVAPSNNLGTQLRLRDDKGGIALSFFFVSEHRSPDVFFTPRLTRLPIDRNPPHSGGEHKTARRLQPKPVFMSSMNSNPRRNLGPSRSTRVLATPPTTRERSLLARSRPPRSLG
ncbi:hypothetical protein DL770_009591 [Monosporascus sp. CRB-9-2]|nr:hypothetical protein DL770_009591 [Monosporascus sp. CRB-9-2]